MYKVSLTNTLAVGYIPLLALRAAAGEGAGGVEAVTHSSAR